MKIIVALDFKTQEEAFTLLDSLDPKIWAIKVGSEMFTRFGPQFIYKLNHKNYSIFLDLKFHDIPTTVANAVLAAAELNVWMVNVHASGGLEMMKKAKDALDAFGPKRPLLIAVTVLTSDGATTEQASRVTELALLAKEARLDGVVCGAFEVPAVKSVCGASFLTITPGIRLGTDPHHDQSRVATIEEARDLGSDFLVIGRSITKASNPKQVICQLQAYIE